MTHQPRSFVPAMPLGRDGQETLVRFLAGRETSPAEQSHWTGGFAAVAALRSRTKSKE
ncbi:hypothetical protein M8312_12525 [Sphingomonas sp. KRR8]|uniref:hypothetical protein n=1 Tax=Sphingomonas sp. KRR8 TaxID=2942996 RepID=UPI00201FC9B4|nr:hypothetical protein [Sphingomonas sp. KRR8]URD60593.1 hypothetical protein M8312_12525 [Sphingomonas sp. KRR8]